MLREELSHSYIFFLCKRRLAYTISHIGLQWQGVSTDVIWCTMQSVLLILLLQWRRYKNFTAMESTQTKFLRTILGLPSCVPNVLLQLETGQMLIESWAWILLVKNVLHSLVLTDKFQSRWERSMDEKLNNLGLSRSAVFLMGYTKAKQELHQRITDNVLQHHVSLAMAHPCFRDYWAC